MITKEAEEVISEIISSVYEYVPLPDNAEKYLKSLKPDLESYTQEGIKLLTKEIEFLVSTQEDERNSRLGNFFRSTFLIIGYFKFVHPELPGELPRLDFDSYIKVFGRLGDTRGPNANSPANDRAGAYTQYYPHEHLDRPECLPPKNPPIYAPGKQIYEPAFRVAPTKRKGTRSPNKKEVIEPDIYSYLRDYIEMSAGLLAEVDDEFEVKINNFRDDNSSWKDNDSNWYLTLAKLGHALHQVEDFFAHSNWIELVVKSQGQALRSKVIPPNFPIEFINRANTIFSKRLKRHLTSPLENWMDHPDENWVVTGYFDFRDTLISLAHISEEVWGGHVPDPYAEGADLINELKDIFKSPYTSLGKAQKIIQNTLDFITSPQAALENPSNDIAQSLKEKFEADLNNLLRPEISKKVAEQVISETIFKDTPSEIQQAFINMVIEGTRAYGAFNLYKVIKNIAAFFKNPLGWLKDFLPKLLWDKIKDATIFYGKERIYDWLGADRIGCHSLLAKDHGLEPLYKQQKECATAVHWYIVHNLLKRYWETGPRQENGYNYIDWTELLEHFLRNPLPPERGSYELQKGYISAYLIYKTNKGDQLSTLGNKFKSTAIQPSQFSWRNIADANFGTKNLSLKEAQNTINRILQEKNWGIPVTPPNYAFKKGLKLFIPDQKIKVLFFKSIKPSPTWFRTVIEKGWDIVKKPDDSPIKHTPINVNKVQLNRIIQRGKSLRFDARQRYRPNVELPCP